MCPIYKVPSSLTTDFLQRREPLVTPLAGAHQTSAAAAAGSNTKWVTMKGSRLCFQKQEGLCPL